MCRSCILCDWSFLAIKESCIRPCISWECSLVKSWKLGIVTLISASPGNKPLWIFALAKLLSQAVNSTLQVFVFFSVKFMISCDILYILRQFIIQLCGTISYAFFCRRSRLQVDFSVWSCFHLGCADICKATLLCLWILCGILYVPQGTICAMLANSKYLPLFALLFGVVSLIGSVMINVVFPLVINLCTF